MKKKICGIILFFSITLFLGGSSEAAEPAHILLVYDSLNIANEGEKRVDSLQRLLTSLNVKVDTVQDDEYKKGMLLNNQYQGVISFVNWNEKGIDSIDFREDREKFTGKTLHIGMNIEQDEISRFQGQFKQLSHRQYTLIHQEKKYQQKLDYLDQSLILDTDIGELFGTLKTQELREKEYPYGVIQNGNGFIPFFSEKGAEFLQSAELVSRWLGEEHHYNPLLTVRSFSPLNDMNVADKFVRQLNQKALYYALSSSSANQNNDLLVYKVFNDILVDVQQSGIVFLSVPAVNHANLNDGRILKSVMADQVSLLVSRNVYPVGLSAPGYWNQDTEYQSDALEYSKTLILEANPAVDKQYYRVQKNQSNTYDTAFYSLDEDLLDDVQWLTDQVYTDYQFPMPTSFAYVFPENNKEAKKLLAGLDESIFDFSKEYDSQYSFNLNTTTQQIQYMQGRLVLNGQTVSQLSEIEETQLPKKEFQGLLANFFRRVNVGLIIFIGIAFILLIMLFTRGIRNYRSKFIVRKGGKK